MSTANRPCPICLNLINEKLHTQKFVLPDEHPLSNGYDVIVCNTCGFVYADTSVSQDAYDRFYAQFSKYEDKKTATGGVENPFDWKRQQETAQQIADIFTNSSASILDVGCANGGLLKAMMDLGYTNVLGIDPSPECVANSQELGVNAQIGSLFQPLENASFDCVVLSHTLEHVQNLQQAAKWISAVLAEDGMVYIEVPDASRYIEFIYAPFQDFNTEHINHFSMTCLQNLMIAHGFMFISGSAKDLAASADTLYPAVFGFWKKVSVFPATVPTKDNILQKKIEEYINRSRQIMSNIDARISTLIARTPSIIVWGTGQLSMKLLAETSLSRADILAFADNNPINHGSILSGKPILAPQEISKWDAPILVTTLLHHRSIAKQIREMGLKNKIVFLQGEPE
jgi:SAM-dependent methyltransferase